MTAATPDGEITVSVDMDVSYTSRRREPEGQFAPGTIIAARYRISGILGSGGMGEVFRADDMKLGQQVALKFLPAKFAREPILLGHLIEEVRLGRLVTHPNVCRIYDIVDWEGAQFVAMEYVEGEDLARLLKRIGRFAHDKAVDIARGIAAGLMAAHAKGVLHRDLKPANVMVDSLGEARMMDFGLALNAGDREDGVLAGTPAYIAPEQLNGTPATVQSDLYALGLVMYELLTGRRVYNVNSFKERVKDLSREIPKPSSFIREIDPAVEKIILRCLSNNPAQRPRSAREVIEALPGGDPLAAAMAAGETPSPRLVAAAATEGSLKPVAAWSLIALIAVEIGFAFYAHRTKSVFGMLRPKSPDALTERAAEIRTAVGLPSQEFCSTGWKGDVQHLAWIASSDDSPRRWERLKKGLAPIWFWVRQEPKPAIPGGSDLTPAMVDPPQVAPGASTIVVDPRGRLLSLTAVPQTSWKARPADWGALFTAAGLDFARFTPTAPRALPPSYADARGAWIGRHPDDGTPIRVEAATWLGTPIFFQLAAPWNDAPDLTNALPFAGRSGQAYSHATSAVLLVCAILGGLLAWRNLRMRRGDRKGAMRMAIALFTLQLISEIGLADHALSVAHETTIVLMATATALLWTAGYYLVYIALEPFVRRRWPDRLIAWVRLLAGDWRDPMVGRDVLVGVAAGLGHVTLALVPFVLGLTPIMGSTSMLQNALAPIAVIAKHIHYGIVQGLTLMIALMILTIFLRRRDLAAIGVFALLFVVFHFASTDPRMLPTFVGGAALVAFIVARFGLLASVAYCTTFFLFVTNVMPTDLAWYTTRTLVAPLFVVALAIWAFRTSLGSQSPWQNVLIVE
jgi:tRNA A-37 threonylcarbamoyl transferase component Bud32